MKRAGAVMSLFKVTVAEGLQYRMAALAGATTSVVYGLIELAVYAAFYAYAENRAAGLIAGLSFAQVVSYVWLVQAFHVMSPNIPGDIYQKIISGDVGVELCRPLGLYPHWFAKCAAARVAPVLLRGSVTLLAGILTPQSWRLSAPVSPTGFVLFAVSMANAFLLNASFSMLLCAARLDVSWGDGPAFIMMLAGGLLSGGYLPLQLWPDFMQRFLVMQPFAGYMDIPIRFYIGSASAGESRFILVQFFWVVAFAAAGYALIRARTKKIIIQGG